MPTLSLIDVAARANALLRRWARDGRGMAAVEFAFIAPIMGVMFIGAVELSQAIIVDRRVTQIASSTADLVARSETTIAQSDITDIMKAGSFIMAPYTQTPLQIVLRELQSSPTSATTVKQSWIVHLHRHRRLDDLHLHQQHGHRARQPGDHQRRRDRLQGHLRLQAAGVRLFHEEELRRLVGGAYTLSETIYQKPRGQWPVLLQSNGTACAAPTFP